MEIVIAMIVIPTIAIFMLYLDHTARYGLDRSSRARSLSLLGFFGWCLSCLSAGFVFWAVLQQMRMPGQADMHLVLRVIMAAFIGWAARNTLRYAHSKDSPDELSVAEHAIWERQHDAFRTSTYVLIALPLLVPGTFFGMILFGIIVLVVSFLGVVWYAQENQLLWTLALAVKHDLPLSNEIYGLWRVQQKRPISHIILMVITGIGFWPSILILVPMVISRRRYSYRLQVLARHLDEGMPLGETLLTVPSLLPFEQAAAIHAAEVRGTLKQDLPHQAMQHTNGLRAFQNSNAINHTLLYLWFIVTWFVYLVGFLMYWIIPKYKEIFNDFGVELPRLTQFWIGMSDWFVNFWYVIIPLACFPIVCLMAAVVAITHGVSLLPNFIQKMFPRLATPMFLRAVAGCADNRLAVENTLESLVDVSAGKPWHGKLHRVQLRLMNGDPVGNSLFGEGVISRQEADAINHAQNINSLPWTMNALAEKIEENWRRRLAWCFEFFQPVAITVLCAVVASFSVGMFMAVLKLINDLS